MSFTFLLREAEQALADLKASIRANHIAPISAIRSLQMMEDRLNLMREIVALQGEIAELMSQPGNRRLIQEKLDLFNKLVEKL